MNSHAPQEPITVTSITESQFLTWRYGSEPLHIECAGVRVTLEPNAAIAEAYWALQAVFVDLSLHEVAALSGDIDE